MAQVNPMSSIKKKSPLHPVYNWLKLGNIFGCPVKAMDLNLLHFEEAKGALYRHIPVLAVPQIVSLVVMWAFPTAFDVSLGTIMKRLQEANFMPTDMAATAGAFFPWYVGTCFHFASLKKVVEPLSKFSQGLNNLKGVTISDDEASQYFDGVKRLSWMMLLGIMVSAYLMAFMTLEAIRLDLGINTISFIGYLAAYGTISFINYMAPILMFVTYAFLQQSLGMVELAVNKCADKLDKSNRNNKDRSIVIKESVETALQLAKILDTMEEAFGRIMMVEVIANCICEVFGLFFGTLIFSCFSGGTFNRLLFAAGLSFFSFGVVSLARLIYLLQRGQGISDGVKRLKKLFRNIMLEVDSGEIELEAMERAKIGNLMDRWSSDSAVNPCGMFQLNNSTGIAISGTLLTYIIVLIQTKFQC